MAKQEMSKEAAEIWQLFQETDRLLQKQAEEAAERSKRDIQELKAMFQETDSKFQETDRKFQETDRKFQETDRKFQETDRKFQETDREFKKTERLFRQIKARMGELIGHWGQLMEALVKPDSVRLFQERGIKIREVYPNAEAHRNGDTMEIDLLLVNDSDVLVIEVKTTLKDQHVDAFLEDLLTFFDFFPRYKEYHLYGAMAGLNIKDNAGKHAYRKGLFVVEITGEGLVKIKNDVKFRPRDFSRKD
ncbi:MAG: hypothetical protein B6242_11745 [Anaerolineaceae bacterium 4572_78]|nr:MAG: hypothetical protein B6242_11745 [Anaerolineaceae bacterium 4572_78]